MYKTNSKEARQAVKSYILQNFDPSNYDEYANIDTSDFHAVCIAIVETARQEKFYQNYNSDSAMLKDWFSGLPSIFNTSPIIYEGYQNKIVGDWLNETEEEKEKYDFDEATDLAFSLIIRELLKEVNK